MSHASARRTDRFVDGGPYTVGVVGVTGTIGSRVARLLADAGHAVVGFSRNPAASALYRSLAVDLRNEAAADAALAGIEVLYLTTPEGGADPLGDEQVIVRNVIAASARAGVKHIVMHTALRANRGNTGARILDNKTSLEAALRDSGVPFSILRPAWYLQNLFAAKAWLDQGMFSMPWPADMVWAATDVDDLARAAVALIAMGPTNRAFDIHQPGGVTAQAICLAVEAVTARKVAYYESTDGPRAAVESYPLSDAHKDLYAELYEYFKSDTFLGEPLAITEMIPGFTYGTLESFVQRNLYPAAETESPSIVEADERLVAHAS